MVTIYYSPFTIYEGIHHVDAEEGKAPEADEGAHDGHGPARLPISFGEYGLKTLEPGWITDRQIEAARIAMTRHIKRGGKVWIRMFPDKPITKKPAETRMGKGKGAPDHWVAVVKPGRILYEIEGVSEEMAREALRLAAQKLPLKCKFVIAHRAGRGRGLSHEET